MVFFFRPKTAYDMRISDWSSDVCSSDLTLQLGREQRAADHRDAGEYQRPIAGDRADDRGADPDDRLDDLTHGAPSSRPTRSSSRIAAAAPAPPRPARPASRPRPPSAATRSADRANPRSEENKSELQSLMRHSYAVFCLKQKTKHIQPISTILIQK